MIISNTQVSLRNLCERAHYYSYIVGVEPKKLPTAIYRGVLGHSALEQYYLEMKEGASQDICSKAAKSVLDKEVARIAAETPEQFEQIGLVINTRKLIEGYTAVYKEEEFKVLEVEKDFYTPINDSIDYGVRLDLLVEMTKGPHRGDVVVIDHKFVYNFKTTLDVDMDAQLPKMVKTLRANGYLITKGMFNQIRTRKLKSPSLSDLYRREWTRSKKIEIETIWREQEQTALEISHIKTLPIEVIESTKAKRNMSLLVCRSCFFQPLCKAELNGEDITANLQANYQKSSSPWRNTEGE